MVEASKILPVVLIALILVSAVQAFQLNALKEKLEGGKVSASAASTTTAPSGSGGAIASPAGSGSSAASGAGDISSLPSMVGGC